MNDTTPRRSRWTELWRAVALVATAPLAATLPRAGGAAARTKPGDGVASTELARGTTSGRLRIETAGRVQVVVGTVTIEPGGTTGWHYHEGEIIVVVRSGTLTRTLSDCSVETATAGQSFVEPAGAGQVHIARNLGTEPVELFLTYLLPEGSPLSVAAPPPCCARGSGPTGPVR